jgi:hypothetical protein
MCKKHQPSHGGAAWLHRLLVVKDTRGLAGHIVLISDAVTAVSFLHKLRKKVAPAPAQDPASHRKWGVLRHAVAREHTPAHAPPQKYSRALDIFSTPAGPRCYPLPPPPCGGSSRQRDPAHPPHHHGQAHYQPWASACDTPVVVVDPLRHALHPVLGDHLRAATGELARFSDTYIIRGDPANVCDLERAGVHSAQQVCLLGVGPYQLAMCCAVIVITQLCAPTVSQSQCCSVAVLQCCSVAVLQCCCVAVLQCCCVAVLQCCSVAVLLCCSVAVLQCYSVAVLQCCCVAVLQCYSVAVLQCCCVAVLQCCS